MTHDEEIDALGLLCPLPVLKLSKRMRQVAGGTTVRLLADDPAAVIDVPHYCRESGNEYLGSTEDANGASFYVKKAPSGS